MLLRSQEKLSCNVLVIGGGGAGLRSAIAAKLHHTDVLLASKTKIGPGSNTFISKAIIAATGWGTPDDDENTHIEDTVKGGCFLNDQSMVAKVAERTHSEITFLKECGVPFEMHKGSPRLIKIPGHRHSRHVYGKNWRGSDLVLPLKRYAKKIGVRFAERVFVTRLMAAENRICGATGVTTDGRFITISAKVVLLATGGYAQIYWNTNNVPGITGDGISLAFDLGVPVKDMEFVQFYPTARGNRGSRLILYERMLAQSGVVLRNTRGKDIIKMRGIDNPTKLTRDRLAQIISSEIRKGKSSEQGVFMDMKALSEETARQLTSILPSKWWKGQKVFKVTPTTHFCMGGLVTDQGGETSLKGLFAVGEVSAGVHGANRLGGNALAEIFSMGSWVGEMAAKRAVDLGQASVTKSALQKERSRLEETYSEKGLSIKQLNNGLKRLMWEKVGVIRDKTGLKEALKRLQEPWPHVKVLSTSHLIRLLELQNMWRVAQLVCRAALERSESRGSHYRTDYPEEDNREWLKNIVLRKHKEDINIAVKPVTLNLVDF